jgi:predicted phosphohydrolase
MALFTISDLHLSLSEDKPMDVFYGWDNYVERLKANWERIVGENDTVVIPGDISWALKLEDSLTDLKFIDALPGKKIILKGNHDYWWSTAAKFYKFCEKNGFSDQWILNNNHFEYGGYAICGTRGWFYEEERSGEHDEKVFKRELMRLEASLKSAGDLHKIVFLHYPPKYKGYECQEIIDLMKRYDVRQCYYGHLHGASHGLAMEGQWDGIEYHLVAADKIGFRPFVVIS